MRFSCTVLHHTSCKMMGFMGCGDLCCEFCDQPSTQMAVNGVKVRHSAGPRSKHHWGRQGSPWCSGCSHCNDKTRLGGAGPTTVKPHTWQEAGFWQKEEITSIREGPQRLWLREPGGACGDGFPVSSNMVNSNMN